MTDLNNITYDAAGLIPAVVRCAASGEVLMLSQLNDQALRLSLETGLLHRYSRSRKALVGPDAGNAQRVKEIRLSCSGDSLLVSVEQDGESRHCFKTVIFGQQGSLAAPRGDILEQVYRVVLERRDNPSQKSYVASLFAKGLDKILGKIGEEATETAVAGKGGSADEVVYEVADLFFHVLVLLGYYDLPPERVYAELRRRFGLSGIEEKASRKG
ncbi:MAG: phosphoribosyl-ATP diphosphatase [Syntrophotalea sp.]|jgi:phosphoribosyl-ATP pyrophosphohydrolase/phosphoribosyl-AMP cyclohydrolase|uniref:phosphoribosyl-ATP diphosphatase n=1 Tax=Syntrophotalea sp. TaxID=2812029 RepID=UPI003D114D13